MNLKDLRYFGILCIVFSNSLYGVSLNHVWKFHNRSKYPLKIEMKHTLANDTSFHLKPGQSVDKSVGLKCTSSIIFIYSRSQLELGEHRLKIPAMSMCTSRTVTIHNDDQGYLITRLH